MASTPVTKKIGTSPLVLGLIGLLVAIIWIGGTVVQLQTSEVLVFQGTFHFTNSWQVIAQPWLLVSGQITNVNQGVGVIYAWGVEALTLVFAYVLEHALAHLRKTNRRMSRWFVAWGIVLIALNSWADFQSSPGGSPLVRGLVAALVGGVVVTFLPIAIGLLGAAIGEF
jgi:hypothetical protein